MTREIILNYLYFDIWEPHGANENRICTIRIFAADLFQKNSLHKYAPYSCSEKITLRLKLYKNLKEYWKTAQNEQKFSFFTHIVPYYCIHFQFNRLPWIQITRVL